MAMTPEEHSEIQQIRADVTMIKKALLGDPEFQQEGYIEKINDIDERLTSIEEKYKAGRWLAVGIFIAAGYGLKGIITALLGIIKP